MHHHPRHGHQGPPGPPAVVEEPKVEVAAVDDLLVLPGRRSRPDHIVVIIRGPPGAGKTFVSRLIKVSALYSCFHIFAFLLLKYCKLFILKLFIS